MLRKKKYPEEDVRSLIDEHIETVGTVLATAHETVENFLNDDLETAKTCAREVDRLENKADQILRRITTRLQDGAFLPIMRKDVYQLAAAIDGVANAAESFCDFLLSQRPEIPPAFRGAFSDITSANIEMFPDLKEAVNYLNLGNFHWSDDKDSTYRQIARRIGVEESNIDDLEWKLTREIFKSDLPLANKMHIHALLKQITHLSDHMENVADRIQIMITREAI